MSLKEKSEVTMKHIETVAKKTLIPTREIGCGECQASCQSACKTSCTVGNQACVKEEKVLVKSVTEDR